MAERSKCDLPYGHYGRAQFNLEDGNLAFARNLTASGEIYLLKNDDNHSQEVLRGAPKHQTPIVDHRGKRHRKQTKHLLANHPELEASSRLIPFLLRTSEAVQKAASQSEPLKGRLIAFAKVRSEIRHRTISLAAIASGTSGSDVRLVQMQTKRLGWSEDKNTYLEVPTPYGEETIWSSDQGAVLQIDSTVDTGNQDCLLAVRLAAKTVILRPVHRKVPLENARANLALDHLSTITASETGSRMQAHVTFNPWFNQQIAFVDDVGAWTVIEFKSRTYQFASRSWRGSVQKDSVKDNFEPNDGWARLSWVANLSTLVVCTRRSLALVSLLDDGGATCTHIDIDRPGSPVHIIDMVILPGTRDHLAVLTRTQITIYEVIANASNNARANVKVKIRHFKSPDDLSLHLFSWDDHGDICLALISSLQCPVCVFRLVKGERGRVVCADPINLAIYDSRGKQPIDRPLRDLHLQPLKNVKIKSRFDMKGNNAANPHFYSCMALQADYSILEGVCLYRTLETGNDSNHAPLPLWTKNPPASTDSRLRREGFIVGDDESDGELQPRRSEPISRRAQRQNSLCATSDERASLELVTNALHGHEETDTNVQELADTIGDLLRVGQIDMNPMRTLYNILRSGVSIGDIQEASTKLEYVIARRGLDLDVGTDVDDRDSKASLELSNVDLTSSFRTGDGLAETGATLESVYDGLVSRWITPLAVHVSGRVRLAKASVAHHVALETFLAARTLRLQRIEVPATQQKQQAEEEELTGQQWDLPVRGSGPAPQQQSSAFQGTFLNSALPTPSPTATPSLMTASSASSLSAAPELHRLSRFAHFQKPTPLVLPRPLVKVLSHWEIGEHPDNYDWMAASRHVDQQEDDDAEDGLTEKERKRLQRRAARHIFRQRKEAAASQASLLTNSQAAEVMSASQPTAFKVESQPLGVPSSSQSQAVGTSATAASQIVPGRFGGRPPPKKRRKQGF